MNRLATCAAIVTTSVFFSLSMDARAGTITVTDPALFGAATTGPVSGDFTDVPLPNCNGSACFGGGNPLSGYASLQGVSFSTPNAGGNVNVNSAFFYGSTDLGAPYAVNSIYTGSAPDILNIALADPATAFALDFNTLFASTTATFTLSNGYSKTVSGTATVGTTQFIGFVSDTAFNTVTLTVPNQASWVVADFTTASWDGVSPVPEPGTWALMCLGLLGLGLAVRGMRHG